MLIENNLLDVGVLTDPAAPSTFGAWINHAGTHHIGAIAFLIVVFFLFFGVAVLTVVQASQVKLESSITIACLSLSMISLWVYLTITKVLAVELCCLMCHMDGVFFFFFWQVVIVHLMWKTGHMHQYIH